jgi:hypothetical protein
MTYGRNRIIGTSGRGKEKASFLIERKSYLPERSISAGTEAQERKLESSRGVPESATEQVRFGTPSLGLLLHSPLAWHSVCIGRYRTESQRNQKLRRLAGVGAAGEKRPYP